MLSDNDVCVHRLWLDVEPTSSPCKAWNLAKDDNLALAKQWVSAMKGTGLKWGIYANGYVLLPACPDRVISLTELATATNGLRCSLRAARTLDLTCH